LILFEWDEAKAEANRRKHGVSFEVAKLVFADPYALTEQYRIEDAERRWQTIGLVGDIAILLVAHAVSEEGHDEIIRIISARRANRKERARYEENRETHINRG
jgi:uncharacterized DUF497 family protein